MLIPVDYSGYMCYTLYTMSQICHVGMDFSHPPLAKDAQITSYISIGDLVCARSLEGLTPGRSCLMRGVQEIRRIAMDTRKMAIAWVEASRSIHLWSLGSNSENQRGRRERQRRLAFPTALRDLSVRRRHAAR